MQQVSRLDVLVCTRSFNMKTASRNISAVVKLKVYGSKNANEVVQPLWGRWLVITRTKPHHQPHLRVLPRSTTVHCKYLNARALSSISLQYRDLLWEIDSTVGGWVCGGRCSLDWERSEREGLIVHPGEGDNIRCLKAATTNPVISQTRIMEMEKGYLLENWIAS